MRVLRSTNPRPPVFPTHRRASVAGVALALAVLLLAGCRLVDERPLYRCLDSLDRRFMDLPELPNQAHGASFGSSVTETREVFEIEQDADVELPTPPPTSRCSAATSRPASPTAAPSRSP